MRYGVKNLILLVLFISEAGASWNNNAWPSQDRYRLSEPVAVEISGDTYNLRLEDVWAWETYLALKERRLAAGLWAPIEPFYYYSARINLMASKSSISELLSFSIYVNKTLSIDGDFNDFFSTASGWQRDYDGENYLWVARLYPQGFPAMNKQRLSDAVGLPYQSGKVYTNTITQNVPGWFAGQTGVNYMDYTWDAVYTSEITRTWWDYTPYHDLGGWGHGRSHTQSGQWEFDVWAGDTSFKQVQITDSWGNPYFYEIQGYSSGGEITSVSFAIKQALDVVFTASYTQNYVRVYSPHNVGPSRIVSFTFPSTTTTNPVFGFSGDIVNTLFSQTYNAPTNVVYEFTAISTQIAEGTTEADYGYKYMTNLMNQLTWTRRGSASVGGYTNSNWGLWSGYDEWNFTNHQTWDVPRASKVEEQSGYNHNRRSNPIGFPGIPTETCSTRDVYLHGRKMNPPPPPFGGQYPQPDNEPWFPSTLKNTFYTWSSSSGTNSSVVVEDFITGIKPWASESADKSWHITGRLLLLKWDFEY